MKASKYLWRASPLSVSFIGAAVDSLGAIGKGFKSLVSHLCANANGDFPGRNWASNTVDRQFFQKLGLIVLRGFAKKMKAVVKRVLRRRDARGASHLLPNTSLSESPIGFLGPFNLPNRANSHEPQGAAHLTKLNTWR